jgi:hypothetical protein
MERIAPVLALGVLCACTTPQPCPTPLEECSGQCVDLQSDRRHCGTCGFVCLVGEACLGARCTDLRPPVPCPDRTGGAFVTLGRCGAAVKLWVEHPSFIDEALTYVGTTPLPRVPLLTVVAGSDCDAQWSWHADDTNPSFVDPSFITSGAVTGCDLCPAQIEGRVAADLASSGKWCPAGPDAKVLAVEPR